jgi:hypothetical protein
LTQPLLPPQTRLWIITDGKAGDENQCLGIAEALGVAPEIKRIAPTAPWRWLMPWGPLPPRDKPTQPGSVIAPPFPEIAVASGRRAVPYLLAVRDAARGRTFTVYLKDPRRGASAADLIWVPEHDRLRGGNVVVTRTSPHRLHPHALSAMRENPPPTLAALKPPRVAVLIGGDSRHYRYSSADIAGLASGLSAIVRSGASLMGSRSRRTQAPLDLAVRNVFAASGGWYWDGAGENPYTALLALADYILVTADSVNMVSEATATGVPILVFDPTGGHRKIAAFLEGLRQQGVVHKFDGRLVGSRYDPIDSTQTIADAIAAAFRKRHRIGPSTG